MAQGQLLLVPNNDSRSIICRESFSSIFLFCPPPPPRHFPRHLSSALCFLPSQARISHLANLSAEIRKLFVKNVLIPVIVSLACSAGNPGWPQGTPLQLPLIVSPGVIAHCGHCLFNGVLSTVCLSVFVHRSGPMM